MIDKPNFYALFLNMSAWSEQDKLNGWDSIYETTEEQSALKELKNYFTLNLDESCDIVLELFLR